MWDLPTPALILDLDAMTRNLDRLAGHYRDRKMKVRPHAKTHKSPVIARAQLVRGAAGICVSKLSEAEMMIGAGITDILVTTGIVDPLRIRRLVALAGTHPTLRAVTDHAANVDLLASAAAAAKVRLSVLVDLNCGSNRSGVATGTAAVALAEHVARKPSLQLEGFQAFASQVMHLPGYPERRRADLEALTGVVETRRSAERAGLEVPILSVGGTGTWDIDCDVEGVTEVQVSGTGPFDLTYVNPADDPSKK